MELTTYLEWESRAVQLLQAAAHLDKEAIKLLLERQDINPKLPTPNTVEHHSPGLYSRRRSSKVASAKTEYRIPIEEIPNMTS